MLPPNRPVDHVFELRGWTSRTSGPVAPGEVRVLIAGVDATVRPDEFPAAPDGAAGWCATPGRPVPSGVHRVEVLDPAGAVIATCPITVGRRPGEEPLRLGGIDTPAVDAVATGDVVYVSGWALLDSRAPSLVEVSVEGGGTVRARTRLPRDDVAEEFPDFPEAAVSGFEARVPVDLPSGGRSALSLRVRCRTEGHGEWTFPRRTVVLHHSRPDPDDDELAEELAAETARAIARVQVRTDPRHLLVFTHSLAFGGGQLWLQELLTRMITDHGWRASMVSEMDGPLRADLGELGVPVHVTTPYRHSTVVAYEGHVGELARFARCSGAGVALVNTLGAFVAADAARRAELPTAWIIHESFTLPDFAYQNYGPASPPRAVWSRWAASLAEVDRLLFVADATREMFLPYAKPERCRTIRYGSPLWTFGGRTRSQTRRRVRTERGYAEDDVVIVALGVVEARKGTGLLISAMEKILRYCPTARLCIVGMQWTPYARAVAKAVRAGGLDDVVSLVPVQRDPIPWLQAADLFVNCSDIESLPRSIMEAVCCGVPVAATDVFGAREMIVDGITGWLFEPNDADALTAALLRALDTPEAHRQEMARAAYAKLADWLDPASYARDYSAMLAELADQRVDDRGGHRDR